MIPSIEGYYGTWDQTGMPPVNPNDPNYKTELANWEAQVEAMLADLQSKGLQTVDLSFVAFSADLQSVGGIQFNNDPATNQVMMAYFIEAAHAKGMEVKVSVGGASGQPFPSQSDPNYQQKISAMIQSMAQFLKDNHIDGLDVDNEDLDPNTAQGQIDFIKGIRSDMGADFKMSYTVEGCFAASESYYKQILQAVLPDLDGVNLMAYDVFWSGYKFQDDIAMLESFGIPASKIMLGVFPVGTSAGQTPAQIQAMAEYAKENGLQGMFYWDINQDYENENGQGKDAGIDAIDAGYGIHV